MICMLPKVNLEVGEMGFNFCDLYVSLKKTSSGDINSTNLTSVLPGYTSHFQNSS